MNKQNIKTFLVIVFSILIGSLLTLGVLKWSPFLSEVVDFTQEDTSQNYVYEKTSLAAAVDNVENAVVVVEGYSGQQQISTGSGFVYKTDEEYGYILTNQHVVADSSDVAIVTADNQEVDAKYLGGDAFLDLAVIRVAKENITQVAKIGSSEDAMVGDTVFTVGAPLGQAYAGSVTSGILSGKERMISTSVNNAEWVMRVLQIDASINPGNSGGPLLNVNGEVIGISSLKLVNDDIEGMGFAIPIEYAMSHIETLESGKKIEWPLLGVATTDASEMTDQTLGAKVVSVSEGSGADKANLEKNDIIIAINDKVIENSAFLRYELYQYQAGDEIEITYLRDGKEEKTKVTLTKSDN